VQIDDVHQQYKTTDRLRIRVETHRRYSEAPLDLDAQCAEVLGLAGDEALLDVGCGPGVFLRYLRGRGHRGRLAGLDQSTAMVAEAGRAAQGAGAVIEWFTGLADALPFADGEFAVISARHMLYHVPDIPAALSEFARVVGPGGVVFVATNGERNTPGLGELADEIAQRFGLEEGSEPSRMFNTGNAPDRLREVFPLVEETILPGALVFAEPGPIVDYVMTQSVPQQAADDPELFSRIHAWATAEATRRLKALGGTWRDPKSVGLYRCLVG
jgi:ubiquinone/menaquinone biosynthesis C-methylase UbiE